MAQVRAGADRIPPQSIDAEVAVLGAMMLDKEAIGRTIEIIDDSAFYNPNHGKVYNAIVALYDRNEAVDVDAHPWALLPQAETILVSSPPKPLVVVGADVE